MVWTQIRIIVKKQERHVKNRTMFSAYRLQVKKNPTLTIGPNCHIADIIRLRIYVSTYKILI